MQYFTGLPGFQKEQVFTPGLFVTLRRSLGLEEGDELNKLLVEKAKELELVYPREGERTHQIRLLLSPCNP